MAKVIESKTFQFDFTDSELTFDDEEKNIIRAEIKTDPENPGKHLVKFYHERHPWRPGDVALALWVGTIFGLILNMLI